MMTEMKQIDRERKFIEKKGHKQLIPACVSLLIERYFYTACRPEADSYYYMIRNKSQ